MTRCRFAEKIHLRKKYIDNKTYDSDNKRFLVALPRGPPRLQHERVHPGADLSRGQGDVLRDAAGQTEHLCGLLTVGFVLWIFPEVEGISPEPSPATTPVAISVDIGEKGQKASLLNLNA